MGILIIEPNGSADLLAEVDRLADDAAKDEQIVFARRTAQNLRSRFPNSHLTVDQIAALVARACVHAGGTVTLGD